MIIVHHLNNSRSQRVLWLLEELGLPYDIRHYQRDAKTMLAPPELKAIHPLGKSPVVSDGDVTVAETGAVVTYLLESYGAGRLVPAPGTPEHRRFVYWLHYAEGSAMPPLLMKLMFKALPRRVPEPVQAVAKEIADGAMRAMIDPQLEMHKDYWNAELAATGWFAGPDFTAADIMMSFPLEAAASRSPFGSERPHLGAFLERIHARPAYKRALERGGPYAYAGN
jgi:glutathione S-transferase